MEKKNQIKITSLIIAALPIPPDAIGRIFESLVRGKEEVDEDEETSLGSINLGLGLYITKEIVAAHGGAIGVTSSEKEGTIFTVRFPRFDKALVSDTSHANSIK